MLLSTLEPRLRRELDADPTKGRASPVTHLLWFFDGLLLFFLISWVLTNRLRVDNDFYYAVFIWCGLTFLYGYRRMTNTNVVGALTIRWRTSLFVGLLVSIYLVVNILNANPTERPSGLLLAFELMWRGVAYGAVDALVLTAFPLAIAHGVFRGNIEGGRRRVGFAGLALMLIWTMSGVYHIGFAQFDEDELIAPQLATTAISLPAIVSANPIGSIAAHTAFNLVATYRTFESDVLVPPEVEFIPDYEPPGIFGPR